MRSLNIRSANHTGCDAHTPVSERAGECGSARLVETTRAYRIHVPQDRSSLLILSALFLWEIWCSACIIWLDRFSSAVFNSEKRNRSFFVSFCRLFLFPSIFSKSSMPFIFLAQLVFQCKHLHLAFLLHLSKLFQPYRAVRQIQSLLNKRCLNPLGQH